MELGTSKRIIAFLVLILVVVLFFVLKTGCQNISSLFSSSAVNNFRFTVRGEGNTAMAKVGWCGVKIVSYPQSSFTEIARAGRVTVAILKDTNGSYDVYRIEGGKQENLTNDGGEKSGLTISPDASRIAFSYITREKGGATRENSRSEIVTLSLVKKENAIVFGLGTNPYFLDTKTIFYQSPTGFAIEDIVTNVGASLLDPEANSFFKNILSTGPNDSLVFKNEILPQVDIFQLVSRTPISIGYTKSFSGEFIDTFFYKDAFYALSKGEEGEFVVLKSSDTNMIPVFRFPLNINPVTFAN